MRKPCAMVVGPFPPTGEARHAKPLPHACEPAALANVPASQLGVLGVSQNYGTNLGVPIVRTVVFWCLYWGPLILGNYLLEVAV